MTRNGALGIVVKAKLDGTFASSRVTGRLLSSRNSRTFSRIDLTSGARISEGCASCRAKIQRSPPLMYSTDPINGRSEEHTSELQSLMRISYAVFFLKKKKYKIQIDKHTIMIYNNP